MSERQDARSAAKGWRNVVPCLCSFTITDKKGLVFDKSHCPRHGSGGGDSAAAQGRDEDRWTDEARWQYVLYLVRVHAAPEERAHLAAWLNERRFAEVKT